MADRDWRLRRNKGWDPTHQLLTTYSLSVVDTALDPTYEGTILYRNPASTHQLQLASNQAPYMLNKRVDSAGPTDWDVMTGVNKGTFKSGDLVPVIMLVPGQEWETRTFASSGSNAISTSTAVGTRLAVSAGIIQAVGDSGLDALFTLVENNMSTSEGIIFRVDAIQ